MVYEIYALVNEAAVDSLFDEALRDEVIVAYMRAYYSTFRMCWDQGYDWFKLIDAQDCDGGVSGLDKGKYILLEDLRHALEVAKTHDPKGKLSSEGIDEWTGRKPKLIKFKRKCIEWCIKNNQDSIYIWFG